MLNMEVKAQRKRAPRQSREERSNAILTAARRVFERDGYAAAKMTDIAADVGVVEGTVFHYFPSKRALVTRVMEVFYQTITRRVDAGLRQTSGTYESLHLLILTHLTVMRDNAELCSVILNSSRDADKDLSQDIRQLNRNYTHAIVDILKQGIAAGELRSDTSIPLVRNTVYGSIEHAMWVQLADAQAIDVETNARQLTDLIYRGICVESQIAHNDEVAALVTKLNNMIAD
jgi:TetR/AcrR family transcriptional regulator, fatty acid metabolism regulator protein